MSDSRQFVHPTLILMHYTQLELATTTLSLREFSKLVVSDYLDRVPEDRRGMKFLDWRSIPDTDVIETILARNEKAIQRLMLGEVRMTLELYPSWQNALEECRDECELEIGRLLGHIPVKPASDNKACSLAEIVQEFSELLRVQGRILDDMQINEKDLQHVPDLINAADQTISRILAMKQKVIEKSGYRGTELTAVSSQ